MQFRAFPVVVGVGDVVYKNPVLLFAADDRTEVWAMGDGGGFQRLAVGPPVVARHRERGALEGHHIKYAIELEGGERWVIAMGGGCGCGHPLKSFSPPTPEEASV